MSYIKKLNLMHENKLLHFSINIFYPTKPQCSIKSRLIPLSVIDDVQLIYKTVADPTT